MGNSESSGLGARGYVGGPIDWATIFGGSGSASVKTPKVSIQEEVLNTARELITGPRQEQYGDADDTMSRVGAFWSLIIGSPPDDGIKYDLAINAHEVALMMICLKVVRAQKNPQYLDSWVDIAGYAAQGAAAAKASK